MRMTLEIVYADGREKRQVTTAVKDVVAFERQYQTPIIALFQEGARDEWFYYLAWSVLHRKGDFAGAFDEFLDSPESITVKGDEKDEAPPFPTSPSDAPSSGSPAEPASPSTT